MSGRSTGAACVKFQETLPACASFLPRCGRWRPHGADPRRDAHDGIMPPSAGASRLDALQDLWSVAGIEAVETREITVRRTFADFDEFWTTTLLATSVGPTVAAMVSGDAERLKARVQARLPSDASGRVAHAVRANAVKGHMPN